jgi:hypothetical protein
VRWLSRFSAPVAFLGAASAAIPAGAAPTLTSASISPDVAVVLDATTFGDEDVAVDNLSGVTLPTSLGALPAGVAVTAYHLLSGGDQLFALDTSAELPGPVFLRPRDVARYDGIGYALEFDGAAAGVPEGAAIDAVTRSAGGGLLVSFDVTVDLGGAHDAGGGRLGLSFDGSGSVGGVVFDDEDVLLFQPSGPSWDLVYDGSALHAALAASDVEAVALPEPGLPVLLSAGLATILLIGRRRMRAPVRPCSGRREEELPCA